MDLIVDPSMHSQSTFEQAAAELDISASMEWGNSTANAIAPVQDRTKSDLPKPDHPPTRKQWDAYRPVIAQLYMDEDKCLKEVQAVMKTVHQFKARY